MRLIQTSRSHLRSNFTDESGQILYRVSTPFKVSRTTTISCVVPSFSVMDEQVVEDEDMQDRSATLAEIDWKVVASTRIRFRGEETLSGTLFRKDGWGWYGRHRVFTAPDGKEYKWVLGLTTPKLILNDDSRTILARYHQKNPFKRSSQASLEIFGEGIGKDMIDTIFVTFVYIEKLRKDKERAARHGGGD